MTACGHTRNAVAIISYFADPLPEAEQRMGSELRQFGERPTNVRKCFQQRWLHRRGCFYSKSEALTPHVI
jgi:hypothetical protein